MTDSKFYSAYSNVFNAVQDALEKKTAIKTVILGEQFTVGDLPKAIINAEPSQVSQGTMGEGLFVDVGFSVILVILEYEPADWFADIIIVMGHVVDAVLEDRFLGGFVMDCMPTEFSPGEIKFQDKTFYGGIIRFVARMLYTP